MKTVATSHITDAENATIRNATSGTSIFATFLYIFQHKSCEKGPYIVPEHICIPTVKHLGRMTPAIKTM